MWSPANREQTAGKASAGGRRSSGAEQRVTSQPGTTMYFVLLTLIFLGGLTIALWLSEPAFPAHPEREVGSITSEGARCPGPAEPRGGIRPGGGDPARDS